MIRLHCCTAFPCLVPISLLKVENTRKTKTNWPECWVRRCRQIWLQHRSRHAQHTSKAAVLQVEAVQTLAHLACPVDQLDIRMAEHQAAYTQRHRHYPFCSHPSFPENDLQQQKKYAVKWLHVTVSSAHESLRINMTKWKRNTTVQFNSFHFHTPHSDNVWLECQKISELPTTALALGLYTIYRIWSIVLYCSSPILLSFLIPTVVLHSHYPLPQNYCTFCPHYCSNSHSYYSIHHRVTLTGNEQNVIDKLNGIILTIIIIISRTIFIVLSIRR